MNDVNACSAVNVDTAKAIGKRILLSVVGQAAANAVHRLSLLVRNRQSGLTVKWYRLIHNSYFSDLFWLEAARNIWSPYLPSNCAATQLFYFIPHVITPAAKASPCRRYMGQASSRCHFRANRICAVCVGWGSPTPPNSMVTWNRNVSGHMQFVLQVFFKKVWGSYCGLQWIQQSV